MTRTFGLVVAVVAVVAVAILFAPPAHAVERLGRGSYATELPPGASGPPQVIYRAPGLAGPMPTNDWWSSLAWVGFSDRMYAHPLAFLATPSGLRIHYPGGSVTANKDGVFAAMPTNGDDLTLEHSAAESFPDARVAGFSDWFVRACFARDSGEAMTTTFGHGSPYVYAAFEKGSARVRFRRVPKVLAGDARTATLALDVGGKPYALFGPAGSTWEGLGTATLVNRTDKPYFSLALLPDARPETLALFQRHAHAHVTDTRFAWSYDPKAGTVRATFSFVTRPMEGTERATLFALYPHQWRNADARDARLLPHTYGSVRGRMKLGAGTSFATSMRFPGVLPALPPADDARQRLASLIDAELARGNRPARGARDTYWEGKRLGRQAALIPLVHALGLEPQREALRDRVRERLEDWFTAVAPDGRPRGARLFAHDANWGTLIGYPASYGSDRELNDHHFHYGYFLVAAGQLALLDPAWASDANYGPMLRLLARDIASPDRDDKLFPFLRCFDPYAGHSWASGHAKFGDGNNNESSSEAMNAWYGLILLGSATGDAALRDLGVCLYTIEMNAIQEYWFDVHDENHPPAYVPSVVTMIWGGKGANATWFSGRPEAIHGINFLPFTGGSLYLGHFPDYAAKNYADLKAKRGSDRWEQWSDLFWMYRALTDPADALAQFDRAGDGYRGEEGNSPANALAWITSLRAIGRPDASVTADHPLAAAFRKPDGSRSHVAWNPGRARLAVRFSDGARLDVPPGGVVARPAGR